LGICLNLKLWLRFRSGFRLRFCLWLWLWLRNQVDLRPRFWLRLRFGL